MGRGKREAESAEAEGDPREGKLGQKAVGGRVKSEIGHGGLKGRSLENMMESMRRRLAQD